jgi:hypothetical protein
MILFSSLSMTACSNMPSWLKNVKLATSQQNGDAYVTMNATLDTGNVTLLPAVLPILNPKDASQTWGTVTIKGGTAGHAELDVALDVTRALSLPELFKTTTLPNNTAIPLAGVSASNWVTLPVSNGKTQVYLNWDWTARKAALGVAVAIEDLSTGVPANLFIPFSFDSNISGIAGIYTGSKTQSGFAMFTDLSGLMDGLGPVIFRTNPYTSGARKIQNKVLQLDQSGAVLKAR